MCPHCSSLFFAQVSNVTVRRLFHKQKISFILYVRSGRYVSIAFMKRPSSNCPNVNISIHSKIISLFVLIKKIESSMWTSLQSIRSRPSFVWTFNDPFWILCCSQTMNEIIDHCACECDRARSLFYCQTNFQCSHRLTHAHVQMD